MPIYEYLCRKCGEFEIMQRITESPLSRCPTCKGKVTKLISSTSFQLKGSGWYVTDYARKDPSAKDSSSKDSSPDSSSKEKGESKSEGKSDAPASGKSSESKSKNSTKEKAAA